MSSDKTQQEIATIVCKNVATQYSMACRAFPEPAEAVTLAASITLVGITATSIYLTQKGPDVPPDNDDVLFTCLFLSNAVSFNDAGAALVEFDIPCVIKTLQMFWDITGRSFEPAMNESLRERVINNRNKAAEALQGDLNKFRPQ